MNDDDDNETMTIKLIRGCVVNRKAHAIGDVVSTSKSDGRYLVHAGSAEESQEPVGKAKTSASK